MRPLEVKPTKHQKKSKPNQNEASAHKTDEPTKQRKKKTTKTSRKPHRERDTHTHKHTETHTRALTVMVGWRSMLKAPPRRVLTTTRMTPGCCHSKWKVEVDC